VDTALSEPPLIKYVGEAIGSDGGRMSSDTVGNVITVVAIIVETFPEQDRFNRCSLAA